VPNPVKSMRQLF